MSGDDGWLVPVIYDEGEQRALVRTLLQDLVQENITGMDEEEKSYLPLGGNFMVYLSRYAPILKHKSFQEECEWRIVTRPRNCTGKRFGYRTGTSMLVPYFRLPLANQESLGIREVVVGPTPHPEQSEASVHGLLIKNDIPVMDLFTREGVRIRLSEVPYRSW